MMKTNAGFTLIELMLTVAVAAVVLMLGVPSFQETMRNNQLTTQANDLVTALNLARAEAIKRRGNVTVCTSTNQSTCTASAWHQGWIVRDDASGTVIQVFGPMKGATAVTSGTDLVRYTQNGFLQGGNAQALNLCAGVGKPGRRIAITATGRPANVNPYPVC